ncbi:hypothetical protein BKA70DRAFT_1124169, partial [Coprinopsis sp. MPI-PUGE-AT-0042]
LSRTFLDNLPDDTKKKHSCKTCLRFIDTYGDMCIVDDKSGSLIPLLWTEKCLVPAKYQQAIGVIRTLFRGKRITKPHHVYDNAGLALGVKTTQDKPGVDSVREHLHVTLPRICLPKSDHLFFERHGDFTRARGMLQQALDEHTLETILEAHHLIHGRLPSSLPFQADGEWIKEVAEHYHATQTPESKWNLVGHHAMTVPKDRLSRISNGLIGDLMFLVGQEMDYHDIQRKWTDFLKVEGPRVTEKGLDLPERRLRLLGYTKTDLERYLVAPEELPDSSILWKNADSFRLVTLAARAEEPGAGVPPSAPPHKQNLLSTLHLEEASPTSISFRNFVRRVLPKAEAMELFLSEDGFKATLFTRGRPDAKSPFVFDSADRKNTMSWYTQEKAHGSNLQPGWNVVTGIVTYPHMWDHLSPKEAVKYEQGDSNWPHERYGIRFLFCLRSIQCSTVSRGLFAIRGSLKSSLESYSVRKFVRKFVRNGPCQVPIHTKTEHDQLYIGTVGLGYE